MGQAARKRRAYEAELSRRQNANARRDFRILKVLVGILFPLTAPIWGGFVISIFFMHTAWKDKTSEPRQMLLGRKWPWET